MKHLFAVKFIAVLYLVIGSCTPIVYEYISIAEGDDLTNFIPSPRYEERPTLRFDHPYYNGRVTWETGGRLFAGSFFGAGVIYTANVTLRAKEGYNFNWIEENVFTHTRADTISNPAGNDDMLELAITITFNETINPHMSWSVWGTTIRACCYITAEPPTRLIDGNTGTRWAYSDNNPATSWPAIFLPSDLEYYNDWPIHIDGGHFGHPVRMAEYGLDPAHCFTIDMMDIRHDIISLDFYPPSRITHTVGEWEIYISETIDIPPVFDPNNLPAGVRYLGSDNFVVTESRWYSTDLTQFNDGDPVSARYMHIRVTDLSTTAPPWLTLEIMEFRLQIAEQE